MNIKISKVGYYHPSNANWSYQVFHLESDKAVLKATSTFGADYRLKHALEELGYTVETGYIGDYEMKYRDIKGLLDIDNDLKEVIKKLTE